MELHAAGKRESQLGNIYTRTENGRWLNPVEKYNKTMVCRLTGAGRAL